MAEYESSYHSSGNNGRESLCPDAHSSDAEPQSWAYFHKPIIAMVIGALMSAAGAVLLLLHSGGVTQAPHAISPACLTLGLMFVVVGLVWVPILKEKLRRKQLGHWAWSSDQSISSL